MHKKTTIYRISLVCNESHHQGTPSVQNFFNDLDSFRGHLLVGSPYNDLDSFRGHLLIGSNFFSLLNLSIWDKIMNRSDLNAF